MDWAKRTLDDPVTEPQRDLEDVIALAGGVPITIGDETIGGVGSAGSTQEQDDACAKAGVAAVANQLR
jgi:glc operon protein GlcG